MNKLDGLVKDIISKSLADAKSKIRTTLQEKIETKLEELRLGIFLDEIKKKTIDPMQRRKAAQYYRTNKLSIKTKKTAHKNSAAGDRQKLAGQVMGRINRTSTGKKHTQVINKVLR